MQLRWIIVRKQGKAMDFPIYSSITKHVDWETDDNPQRDCWTRRMERVNKRPGMTEDEWQNRLSHPASYPAGNGQDNIKMDFQEVGRGRGDWMELAQDRDGWRSLVGTVRNFRVP